MIFRPNIYHSFQHPHRRICSRNGGFTLLELLVVVTISAALILLLSRLYWMVGKAGGSLNKLDIDTGFISVIYAGPAEVWEF